MNIKRILVAILFILPLVAFGQQMPKREFRGAWLHTVYQMQYSQMSPDQMRKYMVSMLDELQSQGINAVIFQIRPQADAFYPSNLEPWSRFLTGKQGVAPSPVWDPLEFMIQQAHKRNMELHVWLNPYRVTTSANETLATNHVYYKHPEWFVKYDNKLYFDPGIPQSRAFIGQVVQDIVKRYDIDAIHMDDYFYPYPVAGQAFPDDNSFAKYRQQMGFNVNQRADWRRENVNLLIKELNQIIKKEKPWVRFGISPFGIYRNERSTTDGKGSNTKGLQNYDDLYADVLLWTEKGWIDYMMPQIYWELGHKAACYDVLIRWWNDYSNGRHMYIGQDVKRCMDAPDLNPIYSQLNRKIEQSRFLDNIHGNCFWPGYELINNYKGAGDLLKNYYHFKPAMIPAYTHIDNRPPAEIKSLKAKWTEQGYKLTWNRRATKDKMQEQIYFCVYRFLPDEKIDLENSKNLVSITRDMEYVLPYQKGKTPYVYVVTAVDRMHNESLKGTKKKIKL